MAPTYKTPGVYQQEVFLKPQSPLPTGVPGFVGFANEGRQGGAPVNTPLPLHRMEEFADRFGSRPESYLADAIAGFFDNGGVRCYVVRADPGGDPVAALQHALVPLATLVDVDLVAVPDAMSLHLPNGQPDVPAIVQVQRQLLIH
jgi:hypothetical protein